MKINDWSIISDEFDLVNKLIEKSKMLILKNGIPKFYIRMLADLEDFLNTTLKDKEGIKKMKPLITRSLNRMKNTVRRHNKSYEKELEDFKNFPEKYVDSEVESSSSDSDSASASSSESESEESDEDEDEESEEEEEEKPKATKVSEN
jgi:translation initiation factor 3 subunit C